MTVNALNSNYYYGYNAVRANSNQFANVIDNSVFATYSPAEDGCDDGKISTGSKVKNFFKGIGNTIKGAVKSLFTPKGLLKAAACIGLCVVTGGAAAPILAGIGIAKGTINVAKGAIRAGNATTDAEAEAAWQDIGGGTFEVAASAVAMKGSVGAMKAAGNGSFTAGMKSSWENSIAGRAVAGTSTYQAYNASRAAGMSVKDSLKSARSEAMQELKAGGRNVWGKVKGANYKEILGNAKDGVIKYAGKGKDFATGMYHEISATIKQSGVKSAIKIYGQEAVEKAVEFGKLGYGKYVEASELSNLTPGQFGLLIASNQV